ncbi:MAG: ExeM/NucH family extracellular endonuclease [Saccharospirillum sp.]|nr:ExeM/NucH family extracellular endonuclease [Saccharospirillum sp.]
MPSRSKPLTFALSALSLSVGLASFSQADLIFSEYIEGSSNNKALEIYNAGDANLDLGPYVIELYTNGNTTVQNSLNLSGSLEAGEVYVIANSQAVNDILSVADVTSNVTFYNGNDVLLLKRDGDVIDRIGQLGNDSYFGRDVTLVRKADISTGDTDFTAPFDPTIEWDSYPINTFSFLGSHNSDGGGDPGNGTPPPVSMVCGEPSTLISEVQGPGMQSPIQGQEVAVEAIVTASYQATNQLRGFFIQEAESDWDDDPRTSEGVFVFASSPQVNVGDRVRLRGTVTEFFDLTQIAQVTALEVCDTDVPLPPAVVMSLPVDDVDDFEFVEGMRVTFEQTLTVNEVYQLGRFGEFTLAQGRRFIPTEVVLPGAEAQALTEANLRNQIKVDDASNVQNPDPIIYPYPGLTAENTLRIGDTTTGLTGVINYNFGEYKLLPTETPVFAGTNPRTPEPVYTPGADLRLASFNVLNYFNGDGQGGGFPTARGARNAFELERQEAKLVAAIRAMNADIVGLMEIENDGFDEFSAIAQLVNRLNEDEEESLHYDFISVGSGPIGDDAIAVGLIYRPEQVSPVNGAKVLSSSNSLLDEDGVPYFDDGLSRPMLVQTFKHLNTGDRFTVAVNHLKSKGGGNCANFDDCDSGDGQANYNNTRTRATIAMLDFLSDMEGDDVLIMGDLNAYSMEDPIRVLEEGGYLNLNEDGYHSYVFDGQSGNLDHALATPSLANKVLRTQAWNINTDEPLALEYGTRFKSTSQIESLYAPTPYRSSDHDPVIIDLRLNNQPIAQIGAYRFLFWYLFVSLSYDIDGYIVDERWTMGPFERVGPVQLETIPVLMRNGVREVVLTVTDNEGGVGRDTFALRR